MSLFTKKDYINDTIREVGKKDNRIVMKKVKIPTDKKTMYSICPRCSKKTFSRKKGFCKFCHFRFSPDKKLSWEKFKLA